MLSRADLKAALADPNVRAFLRAIRLGEGTADDLGYRRLVGGGEFESFAWHPKVRRWIPRYEVYSTAAGAYQIILPTWLELVRKYGFPDFTPGVQDEAAVALIRGRGALADVKFGRIEEAIRKCAAEWASLPGSTYGQRTERLDRVLSEYRKYGGEIAA